MAHFKKSEIASCLKELGSEEEAVNKILNNYEETLRFVKTKGILIFAVFHHYEESFQNLMVNNFPLFFRVCSLCLAIFDCAIEFFRGFYSPRRQSIRESVIREFTSNEEVQKSLLVHILIFQKEFSEIIPINSILPLASSHPSEFSQEIVEWLEKGKIEEPRAAVNVFLESLANSKRELFTSHSALDCSDSPLKKRKLELTAIPPSLSLNSSKIQSLLFHSNLLAINGPSDSGKSTLLEHSLGSKEYLTVYLDRTIDIKSLMGSYICTETIGQFEWKAGPLKICAEIGIPLIFENCREMTIDLFHSIFHFAQEKQWKPGFSVILVGNMSEALMREIKKSQFLLFETSNLSPDDYFSVAEGEGEIGKLMNFVVETPNLRMRSFKNLRNRSKFLESKFLASPQYLTEKFRFLFLEEFLQVLQPSEDTLQSMITRLSLEGKRWECEAWEVGKIEVKIGRYGIFRKDFFGAKSILAREKEELVPTKLSSWLFERIFVCALHNDPCLLVGDTGCGKTTVTQFLAKSFNKKLFVFNLSSGSESTDLLGGYKPSDMKGMVKSLAEKTAKALKKLFSLFSDSSKSKNSYENVLETIRNLLVSGKSKVLIKYLMRNIRESLDFLSRSRLQPPQEMLSSLLSLEKSLSRLFQNEGDKIAFRHLEGGLVKALRKGHWVLIDEVNLASHDLLQKLLSIVEGKSICDLEKGEFRQIPRHPHFRLFCCMNPGKDVGKKELPANLASKFSTINVPEMLDRQDIEKLVNGKLENLFDRSVQSKIVDFYLSTKGSSLEGKLEGGNLKKAHISLRNLARCLLYLRKNINHYGRERTVYDGILLGFSSGVSFQSYEKLKSQVSSIFEINPSNFYSGNSVNSFKIIEGPLEKEKENPNFILTSRISEYMIMVMRAIVSELPVLLEGPTSAGKTSLIKFLAGVFGHKCVRINNHEHTSLEEYFGNYFPTKEGTLVFREGLLVQAVRNGYWLILDELNLAKSEILENLNRLLDDNRELFVPELQETLKPHPNFRIFATQNPSSYSGRKPLSKAFTNRFQCIEFSQISKEELQLILEKRSKVAPPIASRMLMVWSECQNFKSKKDIFSSEGLVTSRDLLKWASRPASTSSEIAYEGYFLLAERLRDDNEKEQVKKAIEKAFKGKLDPQEIYKSDFSLFSEGIDNFPFKLESNPSLQRMFSLLKRATENKEPVLLVGETGGGKTTACQLLAFLRNSQIFTLNCHKYTEATDFLGSLRPAAEAGKFEWQDGPLTKSLKTSSLFLCDEINMAEDSVLERLNSVLDDDRSVVLTEFCEENESIVLAEEGFVFVATMNPGGDYGKKELSPALRNRFTEIFISSPTNVAYLESIETSEMIFSIVSRSKEERAREISVVLMNFIREFNNYFSREINASRYCMTLRDVLAISQYFEFPHDNEEWKRVLADSLEMLVIDPLSNMDSSLRGEIIERVRLMLGNCIGQIENSLSSPIHYPSLMVKYSFGISSAQRNLKKLEMALKLNRAILLEGNPHSGKSRLVEVVAAQRKKQIVKFTLSEQLDISDLLGSDIPVSTGSSLHFSWCDGILLRALKEGKWLILEELNMASQSVLEGLNAILDHRGEIFVPELGKTFQKHEEFRLFGTQAPHWLGGGRKGLPSSFLNRFVRISTEEMANEEIPIAMKEIFGDYYGGEEFSSATDAFTYFSIRDKVPSEIAYSLVSGNSQYSEKLQNSTKSPFFLDYKATMLNSFRRQWEIMSSAYSTSLPLLVTGFGKKTFLRLFAGFHNLQVSHFIITPSTDSGDLIGGYEQEGISFYWKWGIVAEAIKEGKVLIIENKGKINSTLFSRLASIFSREFSVFLTPEAPIKEIQRHPNFRIVLCGENFDENFISSILRIRIDFEEDDYELLSSFYGFPVHKGNFPEKIQYEMMELESKSKILKSHVSEKRREIYWNSDFQNLLEFIQHFNLLGNYHFSFRISPSSLQSHLLKEILINSESSEIEENLKKYLKSSISLFTEMSRNPQCPELIEKVFKGKENLKISAISSNFDAKSASKYESFEFRKNFRASLLSILKPLSLLPAEKEEFEAFLLFFSLYTEFPEATRGLSVQWKRLSSAIKNSVSHLNPKFQVLLASISKLDSDMEEKISKALAFPSLFVYKTDYSQAIIKEFPLLCDDDDIKFWVFKRKNSSLSNLVQFSELLNSLISTLKGEQSKFTVSTLPSFLFSKYSNNSHREIGNSNPAIIILVNELFKTLENEASERIFALGSKFENRYSLSNGFSLDVSNIHLNEIPVLSFLLKMLEENLEHILNYLENPQERGSDVLDSFEKFVKRVQLISFLPLELRYRKAILKEHFLGILSIMIPEYNLWKSKNSLKSIFSNFSSYLEQKKEKIASLESFQRPNVLCDLETVSTSLEFFRNNFFEDFDIEKLKIITNYISAPPVFLSLFDVFNEFAREIGEHALREFLFEGDDLKSKDENQKIEIEEYSSDIELSEIFEYLLVSKSYKNSTLLSIQDYLERISIIRTQEEKDSAVVKKGLEKVDSAAFYSNLKAQFLSKITDEYTEEAVEKKKEEFINLQNEYLPSVFEDFKIPKHLNTKEKLELSDKSDNQDETAKSSSELSISLISLLSNLQIHKSRVISPCRISFSRKSPKPSEIMEIFLSLKEIERNLESEISEKINFYKEPCPKLVFPLFPHLNSAMKRASHLLEMEIFEGNETLYEIAILSEKLISGNISKRTISYFAAGLQELVQKIEEWNSNVPKIHHFDYSTILSTLFEFRKIQRSSWKFLLAHRKQELKEVECKFIVNVAEAFYNLNAQDLKTFMDEFMSSSSIVGFETRIEVMESALAIIPRSKNPENYSVLLEIFAFYRAFEDRNRRGVKAIDSEFLKELKECIKIAGWKSTNHMILKDTVEKFHQKITKVLRNYSDELGNSFVNSSLKSHYEEISKSSIKEFSDSMTQNLKSQDKISTKNENSPLEGISESVFERCESIVSHDLGKSFAIKAAQDMYKIVSALFRPRSKNYTFEKFPKELSKLISKSEERFFKGFERVVFVLRNGNYHQDLPRIDVDKWLGLLKQFLSGVISFRNCVGRLYEGMVALDEKIRPYKLYENYESLKYCDCEDLMFKLEKLSTTVNIELAKARNKYSFEGDIYTKYKNEFTKMRDHSIFKVVSITKFEQSLCLQFLEFTENHLKDIISKVKSRIERRCLTEKLSGFFVELIELKEGFENLKLDLDFSNDCDFKKLLNKSIKTKKKFQAKSEIEDIPYLDLTIEFTEKQSRIINEITININPSAIPSLEDIKGFFNKTLEEIVAEYSSTVKLLYILSNACSNIFYNGFCIQKEEEGETQQGADQLVDGTGVGTGKGQENKTGEIEFEEQVLGNKGEEDKNSDLMSEPSSNSEQMSVDFENEDEGDQEQGQGGDQENSFEDEMSSVDNEEGKEKEGDRDSDQAENDAEGDLNAEKGEGELADNERDLQKEDRRNVEEAENNPSEGEERNEEGKDEIEEEKGFQEEFDLGDKWDDQEPIEEEGEEEQGENDQEIDEEGEVSEGESEKADGEEQDDEEEEDNEEIEENSQQNPEGEELSEEFSDDQAFQPKIENPNENPEDAFGAQEEKGNQGSSRPESGQNNSKAETKGMKDLIQQIMNKLQSQPEKLDNFKKNLSVFDDPNHKETNEESQDNKLVPEGEEDQEKDQVTNMPGPSGGNEMEIEEGEETKGIKEKEELKEDGGSEEGGINKGEAAQEREKGEIEEEKENPDLNENQNKGISKDSKNIPFNDVQYQGGMDIEPETLHEFLEDIGHGDFNCGLLMWKDIEKETRHGARLIEESLKPVLEPSEVASYKGDFKTGKRLNMKKLIPFIASNFRKDRIWLRRADPSKQQNQILLALDNSLSMKDKNVGSSALKSMISLQMALGNLDAGEIAIAALADGLELLQDFGGPIPSSNLPGVLAKFNFEFSGMQSADLSLPKFMGEAMDLFKKKVSEFSKQICVIISDGRFNKELVKPFVVKSNDEKILFIYVTIDDKEEQSSIFNIRTPVYITENGKQKLVFKSYLQDFPFENHVLVKDVMELAPVLADVLRQALQLDKSF